MTAVIEPADFRRMTDIDILDAVARGVDWRTFARCRDRPETFAIVEDDDGNEPNYPTSDQVTCCQLCPVRAECLSYALEANEQAGVWGGMTAYQRRLLSRVYSRKSCPGCSSHDIIVEGYGSRTHEVCTACGVSWPA